MQTSERHRGRSMASHRSLLPALLLLAVITGDASSTMLEDNREPYLEPADEAGYRTYIVLLQPPKVDMDADAHKAWHKSFLPSLKTSLGEPRLRQSWHTLVHGFSARLTDAEVVWVSFKPGFLRAFPNVIEYQQTTRTPAFLGLSYHMGESPSDWRSIGNGGLGMIIGIVDGGIANSHPSMEDGGFEDTEPPQKWTGSCHSGIKCNKKLIGAQNFVGTGPPLDNANGHGTQVASIAAGNFVTGANFRGLATGTSSGMAPLAHVAVYKACREDGECTHESVVSAITAAVDDSVDVISVSFGGKFPGTYDHNPVAVAAFNAMRSGILVVAAAGNDGPAASTICNDVPWLLTVGSGTVDRSLMVNVITDDEHGTIVFGQSLADRRWLTDDRAMHDLLYDAGHDNCDYPEDELPVRVPGRVVVCQAGYFSSRTLDILLSHNASGIVMVDPEVIGYTGELLDMGNRPIAQVPYQDGGYLKSYSSSRHPRASCDFTAGTVVDDTVLAPMVAYSSSRGPSRYPILKPDVLAPGVNILAAMPGGGFGIVTGTSMAAPHVAGAAILLKKLYPRWSPAAIRSALTTTADIVDNSRQPIVDEKRYAANLYMMGAGHVNVVRAMDPGLVYDIDERQYASYICATLGEAALEVMITGWSCSDLAFPHPSRINYPSFTLPLQPGGFTVRRVLTNVYVAPEPGTPEMYTVKVVMEAPQVRLTVDPSTFIVTYAGQVARFEVSVSQNSEFPSSPGNAYFGSIEWSSSQHKVRSPVVVVDGLVTSQAPAPLKLD